MFAYFSTNQTEVKPQPMLLLLTKIKIAVCLSHYLECLVVENHTVYGISEENSV